MGSCLPKAEEVDSNKDKKKDQQDVMGETDSVDLVMKKNIKVAHQEQSGINHEFKDQQGDQGLGWDVDAKFNPNQSKIPFYIIMIFDF